MPATMPNVLADRSNADTNLSARRSVDRRVNGASQAHLVTPRRRYAADTAVIAGRTPQPHRNGCKEYPYNRPANNRSCGHIPRRAAFNRAFQSAVAARQHITQSQDEDTQAARRRWCADTFHKRRRANRCYTPCPSDASQSSKGPLMAFSSWRGVVGMINPTMRPGVTEEVCRLLPEGIGLIPLFLNIKRGTEDEFTTRMPHYEKLVAVLAEEKCDLIHPHGAPPFMVLGRKGEAKIVAEWEKKYKVPVMSVAQNHVNALHALKAKSSL